MWHKAWRGEPSEGTWQLCWVVRAAKPGMYDSGMPRCLIQVKEPTLLPYGDRRQ